uniref:U-box domain-containing protein n=1 Tax=Amphora coffeiformis TaxID=265554 RepID=A0A7S3LAT1_9STRA|mmetsp:Transcript_9256/g.17703  ORF Transcript_9256/g.17703 Transcript_9256/m.17703 type:complete len:169 (-) Transcript_9256:109-615(-)|eukprot:scaffold34593_cov179-Amphora_coffeaeformis.AAC.12
MPAKVNPQSEDSYGDEIPDRFICPLTLEVMAHPLMTRAGHSFERSAILSWLKRNDRHPLTREPLSPRDLVMNRALQAEIRLWKSKYGDRLLESETEASSDDEDDDSSREQFLFISSLSLEDLESRLHFGTLANAATAINNDAATTRQTPEPSPSVLQRRPRFFRRLRR